MNKRTQIILLGVLSFLIILFLGFNLALSRYGAFWQKAKAPLSKSQPAEPAGEFSLGCPVPQEHCSQGKKIFEKGLIKKGEYRGLGYSLPEQMSLLAAFSGWISARVARLEDGGEFIPTLFLEDKGGHRAIYYFQGEKLGEEPREVERGEEIATLKKEALLKSHPEVNFLFNLEKDGEVVKDLEFKQ